MMNRLILLGFTLIVISACSRNVELPKMYGDIPFIVNCDNVIHQPGQGVDSKIGIIVCDGISLSYDYGLYSNSKPTSMMQSFSNSFYAYHYSKFFDAIFIDEKLREVFKDSVQIIDVEKNILDEKYIVICNDCNATARLKFNEITFLYPYIMNDQVVKNHMSYDINHIEINGFSKKTFLTKENLASGVYIAPLGNPRTNRKVNKLSIKTDHLPDAKLKQVLASIRLK